MTAEDDPYAKYNPVAAPQEVDPYAKYQPRSAAPGEGPTEEEIAKAAAAQKDYDNRKLIEENSGNPFAKDSPGEAKLTVWGRVKSIPEHTWNVMGESVDSMKDAFTPSIPGDRDPKVWAEMNKAIKVTSFFGHVEDKTLQLWGGLGQLVLSPAFGTFRALVSKPIEDVSGFPHQFTEELANDVLMMTPVVKAARSPKVRQPNGDNIRITPQEDGTIRSTNIGPDPVASDFKQTAESTGMDQQRLQKEYFEKGLHPVEIEEHAKNDAVLKHDMSQPIDPVEAVKEPNVKQLEFEWRNSDTETKPVSAGAGATDPKNLPPYVSPQVQPLTPPGRLLADIRSGITSAFEFGKAVQMVADPMSHGIAIAQATVKDTANLLRRHDWEWARIDQYTKETFNYESRKRMYMAADEENSLRQDAIDLRSQRVAALDKAIADVKEAEFNEPTREGKAAYQAKRAQLQADRDNMIGNAASQRAIKLRGDVDADLKAARAAEKTARDMEGKKGTPGYDEASIKEARSTSRQARERVRENQKELSKMEENEYGASEAAKTEGIGLKTLSPLEQAWVEAEHARSKAALLHAYDAGMVKSGEGLPFYAPRMMINIANAGNERALPLNSLGRGFNKTTPQMRQRKYRTIEELEDKFKSEGEKMMTPEELSDLKDLREAGLAPPMAEVAKDIRSLTLATAKLEKAVTVRHLINHIEEIGNRTGNPQVIHGALPEGVDAQRYFTMPSPAFKTWKPMIDRDSHGVPRIDNETGGVRVVRDAEGNIKYEAQEIHIPIEWKGPLLSLLDQKPGTITGAMMTLKAKTMSMIMLSPMIHNAVVWGRAVEAFPVKVGAFKIYFEGNQARHNPAIMREAIDNGYVPVGKKFFNQDIQSIMTDKEMIQGSSWMAKALAIAPEMLKEGTGPKIEQGLQKFGDFWHNTLLWDRVADLQMGLYTNFRAEMLSKGIDAQTASRVSAHLANRFAGSIPREAMSKYARATLDWAVFSRQYNASMVGTFTDMFKGLPGDVKAQIMRDRGELQPGALDYAKQQAKRKAFSAVVLSIGMYYIGTSMVQNMVNVLYNDETLDEQMHGYVRRFRQYINKAWEHPFDIIQKIDFLGQMSPGEEFEPGKQRGYVKAGKNEDQSARYFRNPVGKFAGDILDIFAAPLDLIRRKASPLGRTAQDLLSNDLGFGRKIYDKDDTSVGSNITAAAAVAQHIFGAELPSGQLEAAGRLIRQKGDSELDTLRLLGPFAGIQVSKGYPGGPDKGIMAAAKRSHDFKVQAALPDIRDLIIKGDLEGANKMMDDLHMTAAEKKTTRMNALRPERVGPRARKGFDRWGTQDQKHLLNPEEE